MKFDLQHQRIQPVELYELLRRHELLPALPEDLLIKAVKQLADQSVYGLILDTDDAVLASTLTMRQNPSCLLFTWIPEVRKLHLRRNEMIDLGHEMRQMWFVEGIRRVEARFPVKRSQTMRALKTMGFRQETLDWGLREAVDYGHGPEGVAILGLIESDPEREKHEESQEVAVG